MKSGILHLRKKTENEVEEIRPDPAPPSVLAEEFGSGAASELCELDEPRWSVVSFDQMEAGGLTYLQASKLMGELDSHKIAGLCIVTDEAAERMTS
jgi:hypothetical protein